MSNSNRPAKFIPRSLTGIKHVIAIASGKGGVGKSTVAANLAVALAQTGAQVGVLDADIYGPSMPTIFGVVNAKPEIVAGKIQPLIVSGLKLSSIGFLIAPDTALPWRGPMLGKALEQLLFETTWGELDYLIIDLPPGTGDIQLTLCQKIVLDGVILITTPQVVAVSDVKRAYHMLAKFNLNILGVIENMSIYKCSACNHAEAIFDEDGGAQLAIQYSIPLLAKLPLATALRKQSDLGQPLVAAEVNSELAREFILLGQTIAKQLATQTKNRRPQFPPIIVETKN